MSNFLRATKVLRQLFVKVRGSTILSLLALVVIITWCFVHKFKRICLATHMIDVSNNLSFMFSKFSKVSVLLTLQAGSECMSIATGGDCHRATFHSH